MAGLDVVTLGAAKKYVNESLVGVGAIKGSPCEIQSITPITGGNRITYAWIDTNDVTHTDTLDVMDGEDGTSVSNVQINSSNHLVVTLSDGNTVDAGVVTTVKGDTGETGKSAYEVAVDNGYVGSEISWILSLKGEKGDSAYAIALDEGFVGTKEEWLASLKGEEGFAPAITVKKDTSSEYILQITTDSGVFETPNLKGTAVGSATRLSDLSDIQLTNLTNGQILKYDSNLAKFVNVDEGKPTQYDNMPSAQVHPNELVQYTGADTTTFKRGFFYRSTPTIVSGSVIYDWVQTNTQPSSMDYNDSVNHPRINGNELIDNKTSEQLGLQGQLQWETLPTASVSLIGKILQYVGATTTQYKKGYYYQCKYNSDNGTYYWDNIDVSSNAQLESDIAQLKTDRGTMSQLEVTGATNLVSALNILNRKQIDRYEYIEPNLIIHYHDGTSFVVSVSAILNETQIGDLANILDSTVANGDVLQYDSGLRKYKPFALALALQQLLTDAKDYTDTEIANAIVAGALVCDAKPTYDTTNHVVVYVQSGVTKTTNHTDTRFYYTTNGDSFCTSWINDVEFTFSVASVDFEEYVSKLTDVTSTYTENMSDKTKVADVGALDDLLDIVKDSLVLKVNTSDIVDNLVTNNAHKPLSAKQGKALNEAIEDKQDKLQFTTMPPANEDNLGKIYQYVGISSPNFATGMWYQCEATGDEDPVYFWNPMVQSIEIDDTLSTTSAHPVKNSVLTAEIELKQNKTLDTQFVIDGNTQTTVEGALAATKMALNTRTRDVTYFGTATADDLGKSYRYIGTTNSQFTYGYFYTCVNDGGVYKWAHVLTQRELEVDNATLSKSSAGVLSAIIATQSTLGVVKGGDGTSINTNGQINVTNRLVITSSMPTASSSLNEQLRLYTGSTTSSYTQGQIYKCVASGSSYVWQLFNEVTSVTKNEKRPASSGAVYSALGNIVKVRNVVIQCSQFAQNLDLTAKMSAELESGYSFLCWFYTASQYWTTSRPIYFATCWETGGRPWVDPTYLSTVQNTSGNIIFSFLEIKKFS